MSHLNAQKQKLVVRIRRIRGQLDGIERALGAEVDCADILQQVAAARGAMSGLMGELVEDHLREHVARPDLGPDERLAGAGELAGVLRRYWK